MIKFRSKRWKTKSIHSPSIRRSLITVLFPKCLKPYINDRARSLGSTMWLRSRILRARGAALLTSSINMCSWNEIAGYKRKKACENARLRTMRTTTQTCNCFRSSVTSLPNRWASLMPFRWSGFAPTRSSPTICSCRSLSWLSLGLIRYSWAQRSLYPTQSTRTFLSNLSLTRMSHLCLDRSDRLQQSRRVRTSAIKPVKAYRFSLSQCLICE